MSNVYYLVHCHLVTVIAADPHPPVAELGPGAGGWDWTGRRLVMRGGTMWRYEVLLHSENS